MWKLHNKTALFIVHIAESEKIKKTFAFNVDIFSAEAQVKICFTKHIICAKVWEYDFAGAFAERLRQSAVIQVPDTPTVP